MRMKKIFASLLAVLAFVSVASAQPKAIGVRAGYGGELSYQQYVAGSNFIEGDLGFWGDGGFSLTGLYNFDLGQSGMFGFYAGPGAQIGVYNGGESSSLSLGVVGMLGVEMEIPEVPINISLDWRPAIYLVNGFRFGWNGFALGVRYRF